LAFNFELKTFKKGALLQSPGNIQNSLMIIVKGIAEVYTTFGDHEFKIEYFRQGDILNHSLFLFNIPALLPIRCVINVDVLMLSFDKVNILRKANIASSLNKEFDKIL